jgi:hypothetical protein
MRALDVTVSVDHATVGGQDAGPGVTIGGDAPPDAMKNWWPWIVGGVVLAGIWYFTRDEEEEGAGMPAPFDG